MHKKFRWSKVYESSEEELVAFLQSRGKEFTLIHAETGETVRQISEQACTIWCAEGSLALKQDATSMSLQTGDALVMNANEAYNLVAGLNGFICYLTQ